MVNNEIKAMIKFGHLLFLQGLNNIHSGNMSFRDKNNLYIKRHGARLCDLYKEDIIKANINDNKLDKNVSLEVIVHRAIYQNNPGINAVVHAHPPYAIAMSLNKKFKKSIKPLDEEGAFYLKEVPIVRCKNTIGSECVAKELKELFKTYKTVIVKGHGAFAVGKDMEEAALYMSVLGHISKIAALVNSY